MVLTAVGCGAPASPATAPEATEIGAATATTAPAEVSTTPAPTEVPVTAVSTEEAAAADGTATPTASPTSVPTEAATEAPTATNSGAGAASVWVQRGSQLIPVVIDRPRVIDLAEAGEQVAPMSVVIAPDASRIAYGVNTPDRLGIVVFDLNTSQRTFIPDASFGARFSPDGSALVYTIADQTMSWLVVRDLETGDERTVYEGTAQNVPQAIEWLPTGIVMQWLLVPSDAPPRNLGLLAPETGDLRTLYEQGYLQADVTRDGGKAAVVPGMWSMGGIGEAGLTVVDVATGGQQVIVPQQTGQIMALRWSPDGAALAYSTITEWEAPARTLHLLAGAGYEGVTLDLGALGALHDIAWRDAATVLLLVTDASGALRLYELPATATDAAAAVEIGVYDAVEQGMNARILVARP